MFLLMIRAYMLLLHVEAVLARGGLEAVHELVRNKRADRSRLSVRPEIGDCCHVFNLACVFYPKRALCLQRAAAATLLLRHCGVQAEMVIGAQMIPFKSHAWVEVDGRVVNDKPYMAEIYQVLERC